MELPKRRLNGWLARNVFQQKKFDFLFDQLIIASNDVKLIFIY